MNVVEVAAEFWEKSKRAIAVTYKPKPHEFREMSFITAIGMALVGVTGFLISMIAFALRGS